MKISNKFAPKIKQITKQVKINPGFILDVIDDSSSGCQANKKIVKTPWKIDSIIPTHRTSVFLNSFKASKKLLDFLFPNLSDVLFNSSSYSKLSFILFSSQRT